jgi:large subunit ribosomal protein L10
MPTILKKEKVTEIQKEAQESLSFIVTSFGGLKTVDINEIRLKIRPFKAEYRIVKNSLTKIALKNAGFESLAGMLSGPSAVVIERGDTMGTLKTIFEFARTHAALKVTGGCLEGKVLTGNQLKTIASLPSREVLLSQLLGALQGPATNLVSVLQAPLRDLVTVLDAIANKSEQKA